MNLKLHLLLRMTLIGLLCWLAVSIYLVAQSGRRALADLTTVANQLQPMIAADVMRRWGSLDLDLRAPDLGGAAARFPEAMCLRYRARDGSDSSWGCSSTAADSGVPRWIVRVLSALSPGHISLQRGIIVYGLPVGTLQVNSDDASLLRHQWRSVSELLGLATVTLLALDILAFWVIGRALRPTAQIVAAIERLDEGAKHAHMPVFRVREFGLIASGVNRLADRLAQSYAARADLTARLIRLQEDERRELAHELHEEFGQIVTALGAVSASLQHSVNAGNVLSEADVAPLQSGVEHLMSSLRGMLKRMSSPPLEQQGLQSALADLITAWQIRLRHRPRIELDCDSCADEELNDERALCAYRVVQEGLSNIARHAPNSLEARIYIRRQPRQLLVRVSNNRVAADDAKDPVSTGMGLKLLAERVRCLHGEFSVQSSATEFTVQADLPAPAQ